MDIDHFIGIPYCPRRMDCGDLAMLLQRELFGRTVQLPGKRPRPLDDQGQADAVHTYAALLAEPVQQPRTGDAVLMREAGTARAGHIGTYFFLNFAPCVLHTSHALGGSVLHRQQDLKALGLTVEGYYRWK